MGECWLHKWVLVEKAYMKEEVGTCGSVSLCIKCGKIKRTGQAIISKHIKEKSAEIMKANGRNKEDG